MFQGYQSNIIPRKYCFAAQKTPGLPQMLIKSMQWDKQKSVMILLSGNFSEVGAGLEKGHPGLVSVHKIMMEVGGF